MSAETVDYRPQIRQFLVERFSLAEMKEFAFDLGVRYDAFPHQTAGEFAMELVGYFERRNRLPALVTKLLELRPDSALGKLLPRLPGSTTGYLILQVMVTSTRMENPSAWIAELASQVGMPAEDFHILAVASGSIRLLVSMPGEVRVGGQRLLIVSRDWPASLGITSLSYFDSLSVIERETWQLIALDWPPLNVDGGLRPSIEWERALRVRKGMNAAGTKHKRTGKPPPMNLRTLTVLSAAVVFTGIGAALGLLLDLLPIGIVTGVLTGIPVGFFITRHRRRWLVVALLNIQMMLAFHVGGAFGLAFTTVAAALTFFIASAVLAELYGGTELQAVWTHLRLVVGTIQGFQTIDDSTPAGAQTSKPLLGPRLLIVRPGKAAVLERGAQRRVVWPSITTTEPFEYVKYVHHLGDIQTTYNLSDVLTQDLVSTNVHLVAIYGLRVRSEVRQGTVPANATEEALMERIPLAIPGWEAAFKHVLEQCVRQAVGGSRLDELLDGSDLARVEHDITMRTKRRIAGWGITLQEVIIEGVLANTAVASAMESRRQDRERALAMQEALTILADGYNQAQSVGMKQGDVRLEVLRRTIEEISKQLATRKPS